jgi:hypothetical protein
VEAKLVSGTTIEMLYENGFIQIVVAVSALELIDDLTQVRREVKRILAPGRIFAVVTPAHSPMVDPGARVMTGASSRNDFQNRRQGILPSLYQEFVVERRADYPLFAYGVRLSTALRLSAPVGN